MIWLFLLWSIRLFSLSKFFAARRRWSTKYALWSLRLLNNLCITVADNDLLQYFMADIFEQHLPYLQKQFYTVFVVSACPQKRQEQLSLILLGILLPTIHKPHKSSIDLNAVPILPQLNQAWDTCESTTNTLNEISNGDFTYSVKRSTV